MPRFGHASITVLAWPGPSRLSVAIKSGRAGTASSGHAARSEAVVRAQSAKAQEVVSASPPSGTLQGYEALRACHCAQAGPLARQGSQSGRRAAGQGLRVAKPAREQGKAQRGRVPAWPNPRSTGPATAGAVSLVRGKWCIIAYQAYGACLRGPVSSNVRQHTKTTGTHRALRAIQQRHALRTPSKDDARSKVPSPNPNATSFRFWFRFACLGSTTRSTGHKCQASVQDLLASAETTRSTPQNQVVCTDAFECHRSGRRWPRMV